MVLRSITGIYIQFFIDLFCIIIKNISKKQHITYQNI